MIIQGNYEIVLSEVVFSEIEGCAQPKQDYLLYFVGKIKYTHIKINDEIREIADEIIRQGILKMRSYKDCLHIGAALYSNCDYLISWNIEDLSNFKTVNGVRKINTLLGHNDIDIVTPETFKIMEEK
jgi:predicted nucleic acid-binding protein